MTLTPERIRELARLKAEIEAGSYLADGIDPRRADKALRRLLLDLGDTNVITPARAICAHGRL